MFGTWTKGSTLIPTISTKFKSNVLVIKNIKVNSIVDIRVIRAIQHKLFILAYELFYHCMFNSSLIYFSFS